MIQKLKSFFEHQLNDQTDASPKHSPEMASLALLVQLAQVDQSFDENELTTIGGIARQVLGISDSDVNEMIELGESIAHESTSLYEFTDLIHAHYDENMKYQLILAMWKVAYADGRIDRYEEHMIRKVAELIYLPHARFTYARHIAKTLIES